RTGRSSQAISTVNLSLYWPSIGRSLSFILRFSSVWHGGNASKVPPGVECGLEIEMRMEGSQ
ncbi:MAG TPA: hypothetical protein P5555_13950, partial [Candidatus Paceibacterota bacterium]|nr:hypothetical protein [Verrucomicrobiota bacterium]HRZ46288.1 hypothetical protein [Candidatus Paceibacterota bacterium]HRZ94747.1 hypothetical protein [Candidatus Paceibacterota bacterium]